MDNADDSETNAKISDSAYSNSCSNSQSRRSHSSKSTHSGSNSSGSSGYGGKTSTSGSSNVLGQPPKKDKQDAKKKKKKQSQTEVKAVDAAPAVEPAGQPESDPVFAVPQEKSNNVVESAMDIVFPQNVTKDTEKSTPLEPIITDSVALKDLQPVSTDETYETRSLSPLKTPEGFCCVISMHNGVVIYTSASITATLGFPKDIWIGRSFIDFVHPRDQKIFASLITNGLALPKTESGEQEKSPPGIGLVSGSTMVCRIRRYRSLNTNFVVKEYILSFMPFLLKFFFKDYNEDNMQVVYLVIQATPLVSAFSSPNELAVKAVPFIIRHAANGHLVYIDPESVSYLGYLPQDVQDKNVLHLYHPEDLSYLRQVYETIAREGSVSSSRPYRIMTQNGTFIKVETEFSSVVNPWSMKLELVIAKHHIIEGPVNPDVFQTPQLEKTLKVSEAEKVQIQAFRESIVRVMNEVRTKPAEALKQQKDTRCQDLVNFMENLLEEKPKKEKESKIEKPDRALSKDGKDSVMLGGISPHRDSDGKSSTETNLSYNQLNYNENLQRYFNSQQNYCFENNNAVDGSHDSGLKAIQAPLSNKCFSPMDQDSGEFTEQSSNSSAVALYISPAPSPKNVYYAKITETMIRKHNADMERELVKMHRGTRSSKGDREKALNESRVKRMEHFARCNASFHPTAAGDAITDRVPRTDNLRGLKRSIKEQYHEGHANKYHCPPSREPTRCEHSHLPPIMPKLPAGTSISLAPKHWKEPQNLNNYNLFGMGTSPQMQMCNQMPGPSGVLKIPRKSVLQMTPSGASISPNKPQPASVMPQPTSVMAPPTSVMAQPTSVIAPPTSVMAQQSAIITPPIIARMTMPGTPAMTMPGSPTMAMPGTSNVNPPPNETTRPMLSESYGVPAESEAFAMPGTPAPSEMPAMRVMPGMSRMYPVHYGAPGGPTQFAPKQDSFPSAVEYPPHQPQLPYIVHRHPMSIMYGQQLVYPPMNQQMYPLPQSAVSDRIQYTNALNLATSNYEQACKSTPLLPLRKHTGLWKDKKLADVIAATPRTINKCLGVKATKTNKRRSAPNSDIVTSSSASNCGKTKNTRTGDETAEKTDGESSYSSFYSSFFKTDSGAEDSGDQRNKSADPKNIFWPKTEDAMSFNSSTATTTASIPRTRKMGRRKLEAPWDEKVKLTSDQVYNYVLPTQPKEEVLKADREMMKTMEQPALVNEQLGQLYLDLQLQGVASRLTLEEGITSSSSSGEDSASKPANIFSNPKGKRKREFGKLAIIYEEDSPMPPAETEFLVPDRPPAPAADVAGHICAHRGL